MALTLSDYTDNATIRGLLGVSEEEIEDVDFRALEEANLLEVTLALEELNEAIPALYATVKAIAQGSRSVVQTRFYSLVQVYAEYTVASKIANGALAMFAPVAITSNRADTTQRVADPYTSLRSALQASLAAWRTRLIATLGKLDQTLTVTTTTPTLVGSVGLSVDPVTGA